ncbi:hypothetical protein BDZ91DRAFT_284341 [Kalaharituber pfeilii]|nr:hypothetical protein BDZ91DRAFT_284341 [Kalaharituber pfeilii]
MRDLMSAYDRGLLRKLSPIPPRSNQRTSSSPVDDGPFPLDTDTSRRPGWSFTPTSSPITIGPRSSETPSEGWAHTNSRMEPITTRMAFAPEQHPPVFPSSMDYRSPPSDHLSVSSYGPNEDSYNEHIRRPTSVSFLGSGSFDEIRSRLPHRMKSYDRIGGMDNDMQLESSHISKMKHLTLGSETPPRPSSFPLASNGIHRTGIKRRASSPPNEDRSISQSEPTRKGNYDSSNEAPSRRSPIGPQPSPLRSSPGIATKFYPTMGMHTPSTGSSFASSAGTGWSLGTSSLMSAPSSFGTQDRNSPVAFSPTSDVDGSSSSPYMGSLVSSRRPSRPRTGSDLQINSQERETVSQKHNSVPKLNGVGGYTCECCPKKPKRFETEHELQMHENEKQYTCLYCPNRFKNKNEAERHQNSLHLRKHSWSCAALESAEAAFHPSTQRPNFDVCGYCGKEFPASANFDVRYEHLTTEHKFGGCNQAKKFFRADHFRQHLKHSHSGTAGKWTNVLENACMRDEPDPGNGAIGLGSTVISEE